MSSKKTTSIPEDLSIQMKPVEKKQNLFEPEKVPSVPNETPSKKMISVGPFPTSFFRKRSRLTRKSFVRSKQDFSQANKLRILAAHSRGKVQQIKDSCR